MGTSALVGSDWIWKDGEFVAWDDAQIHILTVAVQFGASVFEGIRVYDTPTGPAIFRLREHLRRLHDSCKIYRMPLAHDEAALVGACRETVRKNGLTDGYIRPMVLWGYGSAGMHPADSPLETYVAAWGRMPLPRGWMCACPPGPAPTPTRFLCRPRPQATM
jgi:branched-chain amino acid aminotransferase